MPGTPLTIRIILFSIAIIFSAGCFAGLYQIRVLQLEVQSEQVTDGIWSVSQGDGRLLVFMDTVQQYIRNPNEELEIEVASQLDILWSRLYVLTKGRARIIAESDPTYAQIVQRFTEELEQVDKLMVSLTADRAEVMHARLQALRKPLHEMLIRASQTVVRERADVITWIYNWTLFVSASLFIVLLSGAVAILMLYLENRRATREMRQRARAEVSLRAAKIEAERGNQAKSSFLANMSHELRTPLNAVIGFAELIKLQSMGAANADKINEYAEDIRSSGTYLLELLSDILDLSAIEAGKFEIHETVFDLGEFLRRCAVDFEQGLGEERSAFKIEIPGKAMPFNGDRRRIKQVLTNLLSNAFKFTPPDGLITLSVHRTEGAGIEIIVADNGPGIPRQKLGIIFNPFQQISDDATKSQLGSGLGLGIVKQLVELHQGEVEISSDVGKGTQVHVRFPATRAGYLNAKES